VPIFRSRRTPRPSVEQYLERAELAANRLLRVQLADGRFLYSVHPARETEQADNLVRQAGCAYALALASRHDVSSATDYAEAAARTLRFMSKEARISANGDLFVPDPKRERGKLGVIALIALALNSCDGTEFAGLAEQAETTLRRAQRADGSFRCWLGYERLPPDGTKADYYPGQALLALSRAGAHDVVDRSFTWSRERFRSDPAPAFVGWQALAWANEVEHFGDAAGFVFEMIDWLLRSQVGRKRFTAEHSGGFSFGSPPGAASLVYAEAVLAGVRAARQAGDDKRSRRYTRAATEALSFCARLQLRGVNGDCDGGFTRSLTDLEVRCDNDQHAITAFLTGAELLTMEGPVAGALHADH
jgi:hypothetical protein